MRIAFLSFVILAGCAGLPPEGTRFFERAQSGDNLYPATQTRIYETDQRIQIDAPHSYNSERGNRSVTRVPGAFAEGQEALRTLPPPQPANESAFRSVECCHISYLTTYRYFDGQTSRAISEAVWRRAAGIPPFVDETDSRQRP